MDFAKTLKRLMELKGISRYKLAKEIPCSQASVGNWLNGVEPTPRIKEIALSGDDLRESYQSFTRQERRAVWKSVVDRIDVDRDALTVTFRT